MDAGIHISAAGVSFYGTLTGTGSNFTVLPTDILRLVYEKTRFVLLKNGVELAAVSHSVPNNVYYPKTSNAGGSPLTIYATIGAYKFSM